MKGYRTLVVAGVGVIASVAPLLGVEVTEGDQQEVVTAILFLTAFALRFVTNTPVGKSE